MATLLGIKQNMSTRFSREGFKIPVTFIVAEPNVVLISKDENMQIGLGKRKSVKKTDTAYVNAAGYTPRFIRQVKTEKANEESQEKQKPKLGEKLTVGIFQIGDEVKVTGTTKGRGFAGGVKRWGFHGGPKTHGQSDRHRAPGSIGAGTTPGRVYKGKHMAGHMGASKLTVTGLEVIDIDKVKNLLIVKGAVPGAKNGLLIIEKTGKVKGYVAPPEPNEEKQEEKEQRAQAQEAENQEEIKPENQTLSEETPAVETKEAVNAAE
jgi:large subunit ribosomal protein L3